jgi:hypothetical protein
VRAGTFSRAMMLRIVLAAVLVAGLAAPALADCSDDIALLQDHLASVNKKSPNYAPAMKQLNEAKGSQDDEVGCDNAVARAWQALRKKPAEQPADLDQDAQQQQK